MMVRRRMTFPRADHRVVQHLALLRVGEVFLLQTLVDRAFTPQQMRVAVGCEPEVARPNVTAGRVAAGDLDPPGERLLCDVGRPCVKQSTEIVVPLSAGQLVLELAPGRVGLKHVADPDEMNRAVNECHVRIADADGFRPGIFGTPGPLDLTLSAPFAGSVPKCPFCVRVADVLKEEQFSGGTVGGERAVGMFRERRLALATTATASRAQPMFRWR